MSTETKATSAMRRSKVMAVALAIKPKDLISVVHMKHMTSNGLVGPCGEIKCSSDIDMQKAMAIESILSAYIQPSNTPAHVDDSESDQDIDLDCNAGFVFESMFVNEPLSRAQGKVEAEQALVQEGVDIDGEGEDIDDEFPDLDIDLINAYVREENEKQRLAEVAAGNS